MMRKMPALVKARLLVAACLILSSVTSALAARGTDETCTDVRQKQEVSDLKNLLPLANAGNAEAQLKVGNLYDDGCGVEFDRKKSIFWWQKAAEAGVAEAQYLVGRYLDYKDPNSGETPTLEEYKKAFELHEKAARQNYAPAKTRLGDFYSYGYGVKIDPAKQLYWYKEAAKQNDLRAIYALYGFFGLYRDTAQFHDYELSLALGLYYKKLSNDENFYFDGLPQNLSQESRRVGYELAERGTNAIIQRIEGVIENINNPASAVLTKTLSCQVTETTTLNNRSANPTSQTCIFRLRNISNGISFSMPVIGQHGRCEMSYLFFGSDERRAGNWQAQNFLLNPRVTRFGTSGYQTSSFGSFSDESEVLLDHSINAENEGQLSAKTTLNLNKKNLDVRYIHRFESVSASGVTQVQRTMSGQCKIIPN